MATKAERVYEEINKAVAAGQSKPEAFKALAESYGQPVDSIRGSYYRGKSIAEGGSATGARRPRRRETTPADAVESAKAALQRGIEAIDREVEAADERAREATAEAAALKDSAASRKAEIEAKIAALES